MPDLTAQDVHATDNGKPIALSAFAKGPHTANVVVLVDTSGSAFLNFAMILESVRQLFGGLRPDEHVLLGAFNNRVQLSESFTSSRTELEAQLQRLGTGNSSRLHDAILESAKKFDGASGRRLMVLYGDGQDTASKTSFNQALRALLEHRIMVYGIGLDSAFVVAGRTQRIPVTREFKRLSAETGGAYFLLDKKEMAASIPARMLDDWRSQYLLTFTPSVTDGKVHKLNVRFTRPGLTARPLNFFVPSRAPQRLGLSAR